MASTKNYFNSFKFGLGSQILILARVIDIKSLQNKNKYVIFCASYIIK